MMEDIKKNGPLVDIQIDTVLPKVQKTPAHARKKVAKPKQNKQAAAPLNENNEDLNYFLRELNSVQHLMN